MSRRSRCSTPETVPRLEVEDLLEEIFLRLPPQPSMLPRASLVCKRWRGIFSNPQFLRRFRKHHGKAPLLGFFVGANYSTTVPNKQWNFTPVHDPPDRIPAARFQLPWSATPNEGWNFMGCRHGLAVIINDTRRETFVWDPLTGRQRAMAFPPGLKNRFERYWHAALLCVDPEDGHVHGDCFSSPFKLVMICIEYGIAHGCLYESASGIWGNVVSMATTINMISLLTPSILVGNTFCWLLGRVIIEFDFERQTLGVIKNPADVTKIDYWNVQLVRKQDSGLGLAVLSELSIQLWERKLNCDDGAARWELLQKTIPLEGLFPHSMRNDRKTILPVGYDEDTNVIVLSTMIGDFMLQLDSTDITNISKRDRVCCYTFYPYANFYTPGSWVEMDGSETANT